MLESGADKGDAARFRARHRIAVDDLLISVLPAAVALLTLATFLFYTLDEPRLAQIERDLAVRRLRPQVMRP